MAIQGIIGKIIGGTQYFQEDVTADAVTAVQAGPCTCLLYTSDAVDE